MRRRTFAACGICAATKLLAQQQKSYRDAEIFPAIKAMIVKLTQVDAKKVVPPARFIQDLGCDSLNVVEIVMECEDTYKIDIGDKEGQQVKTVQNLVDVVKTKLRNAKRLTA